jgi:CTP:molybdopterin cytidylyltransferase MocA
VLILGVDQPRPAWVTRLVLEEWRKQRPLLVQPRFAGRAGHPVLVDGSLVPELRAVDEATLGLRAVMERHASNMVEVMIENAHPNVDLNAPENYQAALASLHNGEWSANAGRENNMKA